MTCRDVENLIVAYVCGAPVPPEAAAHIAGCESCGRLVHALAGARDATPPSTEYVKRIEDAILPDLKPVKPLAPTGFLWCALILVLLIVTAAGIAEFGIAGWRALGLIQKIAVFGGLSTVAVVLAFSAVRQIVPGTRVYVAPHWLVVASLAGIGAIVAVLFHPHGESAFVATGLVCLRIGIECAIPAGLLSWLVLRRGLMLNPVWTGVTAATFAGINGLTVLEILCPNLNQYHILVWHLGAVLVSAAAGMAVGAIVEYAAGRSPAKT